MDAHSADFARLRRHCRYRHLVDESNDGDDSICASHHPAHRLLCSTKKARFEQQVPLAGNPVNALRNTTMSAWASRAIRVYSRILPRDYPPGITDGRVDLSKGEADFDLVALALITSTCKPQTRRAPHASRVRSCSKNMRS